MAHVILNACALLLKFTRHLSPVREKMNSSWQLLLGIDEWMSVNVAH